MVYIHIRLTLTDRLASQKGLPKCLLLATSPREQSDISVPAHVTSSTCASVVFMTFCLHTELRKSLCKWFGEICSCCSLTALPGSAWVLVKFVLHRLFLSFVCLSVFMKGIFCISYVLQSGELGLWLGLCGKH